MVARLTDASIVGIEEVIKALQTLFVAEKSNLVSSPCSLAASLQIHDAALHYSFVEITQKYWK